MSFYNFKKIQVVPACNDFLDIVLSKTQRKTPTVIHKGYKISRIRNFYMRKVKFTQDTFDEKLGQILNDFPKLDDVHPFYADLINVLYDRDHYKLALGQINTARHLIDNVAKDYVRLLKFGDSLYRCKQLKRAALGRMATVMSRQKDSLAYLEQVRQHLARLPSIDPNTRTLLVCGYPNVGKSSFLNKVTRAEVDVQPYAFTTKSLFVGHMDYKYLRWQVIDTPGILDHPLEERNTIEMQSITALAHLRACILFFIDISERCGYTIADQIKLFNSIKPLFTNKPILLVINKIDLIRPEQLNESDKQLLQSVLDQGYQMAQSSCMTEEGIMDVRNTACEKLLALRVEAKMKGQKINDVLNRLHLSVPKPRDEKTRPAFVPPTLKERVRYDLNDTERPQLERDLEEQNGGAGVFNADLKKRYLLANDEWKYDKIPEIMDGKNVADFIDPEIEEKLRQLEEEEERLEAEGAYASEHEMEDSEEENMQAMAKIIREKKKLLTRAHQLEHNKNRPRLPLKTAILAGAYKSSTLDAAENRPSRSTSTTRKRARSSSKFVEEETDAMSQTRKRHVSMSRDRSSLGLRDEKEKTKVEEVKRKQQRLSNQFAKRGESDRAIQTKMPKYLFSGKRKMGSTSHR